MEFFYLHDEEIMARDAESGKRVKLFGLDTEMSRFLVIDPDGRFEWFGMDDLEVLPNPEPAALRRTETHSETIVNILRDSGAREFIEQMVSKLAKR